MKFFRRYGNKMTEREKIKYNIIKKTAPGTALRQGLDNVLKANTGGLIVIGDEEVLKEVRKEVNIFDFDQKTWNPNGRRLLIVVTSDRGLC